MIIIGSSLDTSFTRMLAFELLNKELPVIEVNIKPVINKGHNLQLIGRQEDILPKLFDEYYRLRELSDEER